MSDSLTSRRSLWQRISEVAGLAHTKQRVAIAIPSGMSLAFGTPGNRRAFSSRSLGNHGLYLVAFLGVCHWRLLGYAADLANAGRAQSEGAELGRHGGIDFRPAAAATRPRAIAAALSLTPRTR